MKSLTTWSLIVGFLWWMGITSSISLVFSIWSLRLGAIYQVKKTEKFWIVCHFYRILTVATCTIQAHAVLASTFNSNECTGVQNLHRYMHAYSMAHCVAIILSMYNIRSMELHTCTWTELHTLHLSRVQLLSGTILFGVSDKLNPA